MKNRNIHTSKGFSLIELLIVIAILGVIASIAVPSYTESVRKAKRSDAKVELLRIAQMQESYFVQNLSYAKGLRATAAQGGLYLGGAARNVESEQGEYTIWQDRLPSNCNGFAGANACTGFSLSAVPKGGQAQDKCGNLTLTNTGVKGRTGTGETLKRCWR